MQNKIYTKNILIFLGAVSGRSCHTVVSDLDSRKGLQENQHPYSSVVKVYIIWTTLKKKTKQFAHDNKHLLSLLFSIHLSL